MKFNALYFCLCWVFFRFASLSLALRFPPHSLERVRALQCYWYYCNDKNPYAAAIHWFRQCIFCISISAVSEQMKVYNWKVFFICLSNEYMDDSANGFFFSFVCCFVWKKIFPFLSGHFDANVMPFINQSKHILSTKKTPQLNRSSFTVPGIYTQRLLTTVYIFTFLFVCFFLVSVRYIIAIKIVSINFHFWLTSLFCWHLLFVGRFFTLSRKKKQNSSNNSSQFTFVW